MRQESFSIDRTADLPWYTEGPVVDHNGNIYFTTLTGGKIMRIEAVNGRIEEWARGIKPNGQFILPNGHHLVCDSGNASVSRYDAYGRLLGYDLFHHCAGHEIYVPNDLVADHAGGVYFTDSIRETGKLCYYAPDGIQRIIATNLDFPNGVALSPDSKYLLVAESYQNRILYFSIGDDGIAGERWEVFVDLPTNTDPNGYNLPDGIRFREDGTLWIAHYGMQAIQVVDAGGVWTRSIAVDFPLPSNLCLLNDSLVVTGGYSEPGPGGVQWLREGPDKESG